MNIQTGFAGKLVGSDLYSNLVRHAEASIRDAAYFAKPYPLIQFAKFFPEDFYRDLLAEFADLSGFDNLIESGTRKILNLDGRAVPGASLQRQEMAELLSAVLSAPELEVALRDRLEAGLRIRANGSGASWPLAMFPRPVFYADFDGYSIKPHPDTRKKVVTMQIYLAKDESQRDLGTTIYKVGLSGIFHWKTYGLVPDRTLPFLPNTGYAFVVIHPKFAPFSTSWHGRGTISVTPGQPRLTILNTYYARPAESTEASQTM